MQPSVKRLKAACYTANVSMSIVGNLSPLLFLTFRSLYGISFSLLGTLVLVNFVTQLGVDLIFSFFSKKFNIPKTVKSMPWITVGGLSLFALAPLLFPDCVYLGLVLGTAVFSAAAGLAEVLISPVIAALPSDNPDREMSKLHSVYAWGVVFVILVGSSFLSLFGTESWQFLTVLFLTVPLCSGFLFAGSDVPDLGKDDAAGTGSGCMKNSSFWLCVTAIFLGGASECTMAQWCSGYLEQALEIPKLVGDIFGVAMFSVMLGCGRTLYAKYGKSIERVLLFGISGALVCYLTAALSTNAVLGLAACALTGFFTSMLWPGSLIVASEGFPTGGVFLYAMMAAGGDLGGALVPQMVGIVTDSVSGSQWGIRLAESWNLAPEQLGMKAGLLFAALFPLIGIAVFAGIRKKRISPSACKH